MTRFYLFISSFLLACAAYSVPSSGIEGFSEVEPYSPDSKEFSCANMSHDEWAVGIGEPLAQVDGTGLHCQRGHASKDGHRVLFHARY